MLSFPLSSPSFTSVQLQSPNPLTGKLSPQPPSLKFRRLFASPRTTASSFYQVLEISFDATNEEIKTAYRRLARCYHPDVAAAAGEDTNSGDDFMRVHAAYSVLSDPDKRADYDRKLNLVPQSQARVFPGLSASPTSSFCRFPRRNWETDQCW